MSDQRHTVDAAEREHCFELADDWLTNEVSAYDPTGKGWRDICCGLRDQLMEARADAARVATERERANHLACRKDLFDATAELARLKAELATAPLKRLQTLTAECEDLRTRVADLEEQLGVADAELEERR